MEKEVKVWDKQHEWAVEIESLKTILAKTQLVETVKWGAPVYTYNGKNVVGIAGFKNYFTLWFYKGVLLKDEAGKLVSADDKTKSLRQWRFASVNELDEKLILHYVNEAIEIEKAGLAIKPEKKSNAVPELLQQALGENDELKAAFSKLTPGKQREYSEYIAEAKQEKTKLSRLEKIKPMILEGKGLNDKYK
ncbi:YdeI/OmpD-associated family protein [Flavobacterium sp. J372]|uniref:YdeI/OmpD-associated family protein n=1 Tax=Flavobacterium sp. J372 TaxID=2898436 RepID=UPI0021514149|nr:YdeI/OmpD-associated family protein [Flavobacterium sp. J372]MCR5862889.1 YdeI/OmpD-associated family protein [Flavobacterium sp. J372]